MTTSASIIIKRVFVTALLISAFALGLLAPQPAAAQSLDNNPNQALILQLMEMVQQLMVQLAALQGTASPEGASASNISVGDRVQTTGILRIRSEASAAGSIVGKAASGDQAKVIDGPRYANGYTWWKLRYDGGNTTGWSAENWLYKIIDRTEQEVFSGEDDVSVKVYTNEDVVTYGDTLKIYWNQDGSMPKGSKACASIERVSDGKLFAHPSTGGPCVSIAGEEPTRSVSGEVTRSAGYDFGPGKYRAKVTLHYPSDSAKDGKIIAYGYSDYFHVTEQLGYYEGVEILRFEADVDDYEDDPHAPRITFTWATEGTSACYIHGKSGSVSGSEGTSGTYELTRTHMTEKYQKDFIDGANTFELRCQSAYTGKDATVSSYATVNLDYAEDYKMTVNGTTKYEKDDMTYLNALDRCHADVSDWNISSGHQPDDIAKCYWGDEMIDSINQWKG